MNPAPQHLRIGPVGLRLHGDHPAMQRLATVLAPVPADGPVNHDHDHDHYHDHDHDHDLYVGTIAPPDDGYAGVHRSQRFPYRFETRTHPGGSRYDLTTRSGRPIHAIEFYGHPLSGTPWTAAGHVQPSRVRSLVPRPLVRAATREHEHWNDVVSTILATEVLEPLLWLALLDHDATLVHAGSVVSPSGAGVLLTGAGGAGKTPAVLSLVLEHGWGHLGDDLTIVGPEGMTHLPRPVRLAHHHGILVNALAGHIHVPRRGRRRRVLPRDLFGPESVTPAAPLTAVVNLEVVPTATKVHVTTTSRADLVQRASAVLCNEFWELLRFVNANAVLDPSAPSIADVHDRVVEQLDRHLPEGDVLEIRTPPATPAHHVASVLERAVG